MIISHAFLSIKMPEKSIKESFSSYEVIQRLGGEKNSFIFEEDINKLLNLSSVSKVYALDMRAENAFDDLNGKSLPLIVLYNDELFQELIEENSNLKGVDYKNNDVVILINDLSSEGEVNGNITFNTNDVVSGNIKNIYDNNQVNSSEIKLKITNKIDGKGIPYGGSVKMDKQYFIINEKVGRGIYEELSYNDVMLDYKGDDIKGLSMEISELFKDKEGLISGAYTTEIERGIRQLYASIVLTLYIIMSTAIVGFLNMKNTIRANIINRRKEYGMLRAVGMENRILKKIICLENIKLSSYASIFSSLIAIPISMYINGIITEKILIKAWVFIVIGILAIGVSFLVSYFECKKGEKKSIITRINE